jgi:ParB family chromosome partitioning protein
MVEQKRGLGRGLSALLEEVAEPQGQAPMAGVTESPGGGRSLPIELIRRNPDQPRRNFDEQEIESLAQSLREKGLLQPILVRPAPGATGEYQIVAGERRWRAAQRAGLRELPVVVRELSDDETLEIAILENVQRADLNPIEEAAGYKALMERFGRTQEAVAQAVGKSRAHVTNTLRLLALPATVQTHVIEGRLTAGHARAIIGAPDEAAFADRVIAEGLSVRQVEALSKAPGGKAAPKAPKGKDVNTLDLEKRLSEALGLAVEVIDRNGLGEVRVKYRSLEQLDFVCRKLTAQIR